MIENNVFERTSTSANEMSGNLYNIVIGLVIFWGFAVNLAMLKSIPYESVASVNPWIFFIGYFVSCVFGIYLFVKSDNPLVSFIGYNFIVVPIGFVLTIALHGQDAAIVESAIQITAGVTIVMMLLGAMYPAFFESIGRGLFIALIVAIIVELVAVFVFGYSGTIIDYAVALIFCGYIGYDWARANAIPKTLDNAIDSAASLYIDIINLFLRILSILNNK